MRNTTHFPKDSSNSHLSIRDSTMTSWQKGSYLHIKWPIIKLIIINKWQGKTLIYVHNTTA